MLFVYHRRLTCDWPAYCQRSPTSACLSVCWRSCKKRCQPVMEIEPAWTASWQLQEPTKSIARLIIIRSLEWHGAVLKTRYSMKTILQALGTYAVLVLQVSEDSCYCLLNGSLEALERACSYKAYQLVHPIFFPKRRWHDQMSAEKFSVCFLTMTLQYSLNQQCSLKQ